MSVPTWKQNESGIKFLDNYKRIRRELNLLLCRDFGLKPRTYSVELLEEIYQLTEEDKKTFDALSEKYNMKSCRIIKYPEWLVESWKREIRESARMLGREIELANSIYIKPLDDIDESMKREMAKQQYLERRGHWDAAIGYCNDIKDSLHEIIDTVKGISLGQFEIIQDMVKKEIELLKGVRTSDNRMLKKILNK